MLEEWIRTCSNCSHSLGRWERISVPTFLNWSFSMWKTHKEDKILKWPTTCSRITLCYWKYYRFYSISYQWRRNTDGFSKIASRMSVPSVSTKFQVKKNRWLCKTRQECLIFYTVGLAFSEEQPWKYPEINCLGNVLNNLKVDTGLKSPNENEEALIGTDQAKTCLRTEKKMRRVSLPHANANSISNGIECPIL